MFRFFEGLINPFPQPNPEQPPEGIYAFCRHYCRGIEKFLLMMAVLTAVTAVSEALLFALLGQIVDWLAQRDPETYIQQEWRSLLAMSLFVLVFMPAAVILQSLIINQTLMGNFPMLVRWLSHRHLLGQSYGFFQNEFSGRIATKVMQTALAVRESVMKLLDVMLFVSIYLSTTLILVASADLRLSAPLLVWLVFYVMLLRFFVPRLQGIATRQADARSVMTGRIVDSYSNILTLKLFSQNRREAGYVKEGMEQFLHTVYPQMQLVTKLNICVWLLNMLMVFSIAAVGINLWMQQAITPGAIAIALSLAIRLTGMSHWIMWEVSNLFENIGTVKDGINTLSKPHKVVDSDSAGDLVVSQGKIQFSGIDFSYGTGSQIFRNLNLVIAPGEKVGIVGRSGAGKSTLVSLLLRFYNIERGAIEVDGTDISSVIQESLRSHIGVVTQDTSLLHRSVRENIMFGRPDASEEQMIAASEQAQAHDFIQQLRDSKGRTGYEAHVGERGVTLSGGQRQRIAIARVLLKDAPILVLDEATSALDSEIEATIQHNLYPLMEGKTVLAIAHRLSTIAAMDRLIVLDQGAIVEQGSHAQLIANEHIYAKLWQHQSGGFLGFN